MKNMKPIAIVALVVILGIWAYSTYQKDQMQSQRQAKIKAYQHAIIAVYNHQATCRSWLIQEPGRVKREKWWSMGAPGVWHEYIQKLSCADTSGCPPDFQQAWLSFLGAQRNLAENNEQLEGWISWAKNTFILAGGGGLPAAWHNIPPLERAVREAKLNMQLSAQKWGVTFNSGLEDKK